MIPIGLENTGASSSTSMNSSREEGLSNAVSLPDSMRDAIRRAVERAAALTLDPEIQVREIKAQRAAAHQPYNNMLAGGIRTEAECQQNAEINAEMRNPEILQQYNQRTRERRERRTREQQARQNAEINAEMRRQMAEIAQQSGQPIRTTAPRQRKPAPLMAVAVAPAQEDLHDPTVVARRQAQQTRQLLQREQEIKQQLAQLNGEIHAEMLRQTAIAQSGQPIGTAAPHQGPAPQMVPAQHPAQMDPLTAKINAARARLNYRLGGGERMAEEIAAIQEKAGQTRRARNTTQSQAQARQRRKKRIEGGQEVAAHNSQADAALQIGVPFIQVEQIGKRARIEDDPLLLSRQPEGFPGFLEDEPPFIGQLADPLGFLDDEFSRISQMEGSFDL